MRPGSIQRQLSVGLVLSLLLSALLLGIVASWMFERALREYALDNLRTDADSVLAAIERGPAGFALESSRLLPAYRTPLSGRYFIVDMNGTRWRSRSLWDAELAWPAAAGALPALIDGPQQQRLLCLRTDYRRYGTDVVVVVAADVAPLLAEFRRIGLWLLALGIAAVLLLVWLQRVWMRHALAPLAQAEHQLRQLQRGGRERLDAQAVRELQPLIDEINRLLQFTRQSLLRSRHALGNLGHALKTPLAVLISLADRAEPELKVALQTQLTQMQQRIGRELGRARTAGDVVPGVWFQPRQDLPLLIESLRRAHARDLAVRWQAPEAALPFERDDMLELLGNLLDNACKWARTGIALELMLQPQVLIVTVADDGPGIAAAQREQVLARGSRLDEHTAGHGLGLGIVSDIVAAYRGELVLGQSAPGGLLVTVTLPLPAAG